jgi:hypothetical protein
MIRESYGFSSVQGYPYGKRMILELLKEPFTGLVMFTILSTVRYLGMV